ncbi:MBL fold metallo-hydrolase [soil metagenome]
MFLRQITDTALAQNVYLIGCQRTGEAIVIDPERDVDRYLKVAKENGLRITSVADTHIHADYLTGARELMEHHDATGYFSSAGGADWQFEWARDYPKAKFLSDGDSFQVGNILFKAILTAGHTPEHLSYLVTDIGGGATEPMALLSGDFLFVGDVGRPDLLESAAGQRGAMEPAAHALYASLRAMAAWPEHLQILPAHGAGSACGKALGAVPNSVLGYERKYNQPLLAALSGDEKGFVKDILAGQPEPPVYFARMKRDNCRGPVLLPGGALPTPVHFTAAQIVQFSKNAEGVVLDLRSDRAAFMQRHVKGALYAPLPGGKLPIVAGSYVEETQSMALLLEKESDLDEVVRQLSRIGLDGIAGWATIGEVMASLDDHPECIGHIPSIDTSTLAGALALHPGARVLDVRGDAEFKAFHVREALHIPYTRLLPRLPEIPSTGALYVHCGSGLRASLAVPYLARKGYEVIHVDGADSALPASMIERGTP